MDEIVSRIWIGSQPSIEEIQKDFDVWVNCDKDSFKPDNNVQYYHISIIDDNMSPIPFGFIFHLSQMVFREYSRGKKILITCESGTNLSGLVTAVIVFMVTGKPMEWCISQIKEKRGSSGVEALSNDKFVRDLRNIFGLYEKKIFYHV